MKCLALSIIRFIIFDVCDYYVLRDERNLLLSVFLRVKTLVFILFLLHEIELALW